MQNQSFYPIKIFYCYAPEDHALQEELARHLSPLRRLRDITTWFDRDIQAGAEWQRVQEVQMETAHMILLLISADFMASDYCYTVEMTRALDRHRAGTAHVIPILLRPVEWEKTPLGGLSALPTGKRPVTQWADRDAAWLNIVQGIHELIRTLLPMHLLSPQAVEVLYPEPEMSPRHITGQQPAGRMLHQRYRLLHTVGQGGMGAVYVAQDTHLGDRLVAVKEMSTSRLSPQDLPRAVEQFRREAHLLASLHHPNLPVIHEYFREDDRWYLVMSFIEGQNLQVALNVAPKNRLPVNEVVRIGIELCEVLDYLHTHNPQIIFRDLKPANIMLTPKRHIYLIDFGIARHFKQEQIKDTAYFYSVGYAPPEQYGQSQTGPRSDIYSLGATLHQMLSGHNPVSRPFQFPNLRLVDPTLPVPLVHLVAQMLEMNEQARPASVAEIKAQLGQILALGQIPTKKKAVIGEGVKSQTGRFNLASYTTSALAYIGIDSFSSIRQQVPWTSFIALSLIIGELLPWLSNNQNGYGSQHWRSEADILIPIFGAIGVAGVGSIYLLLKKRLSFIDLFGGFAIIGIAAINLMSRHWGDSFTDFISLPLFIFWLIVGTRCFLRSANTVGGLFLGSLLLVVAILFSWHLQNGWGYFQIWFVLLPMLLCGVAALIVALHKRKHNALSV